MIKKTIFTIRGMRCASCAKNIENKLKKESGVQNASVSYSLSRASIEHDVDKTDEKKLVEAVNSMGYKAFFTAPEAEGFATDPVCGMRVSRTNSIKKQFDGRIYHFCSEECVRKFESPEDELKKMKRRMAIALSGVLVIAAFRVIAMFTLAAGVTLITWAPVPSLPWFTWGYWLFILTTPVQFIGGWTFYVGAYNALKNRVLNMDFLIAMGTLTAWGFSTFVLFFPEVLPVKEKDVYFEVSAVIIAFVLLGKFIEDYMKQSTSAAVRKLLDLRPKTARVMRDGKETEILAEEIMAGEIIVVRPGEKIPVDGIVIEGESSVNQAMITGESMPVPKKKSDEVIGSTINTHGMLKFKATKVGSETTLMQIVKMVEEAQASSAPIQRLADKVSSYFIPAVIGIAFLTFAAWWLVMGNFTMAILAFVAVLIISCPCALGIATPAALMVGVGKGAEAGILIRGGEYLERAYKLQKVIFDKTGTLTKGKPEVTDMLPTKMRFGAPELLQLAASVEINSEHPLARAVVECARDHHKIKLFPSFGFIALPGHGVKANVKMSNLELEVIIGTRKLMKENNAPIDKHALTQLERLENEGKTVLTIALRDKKRSEQFELAGLIAVADTLKEHAAEAVRGLAMLGIESIMLTGDNERTAKVIAKQIGIKRVFANVLPGEKLDAVKKLQAEGNIVAMVGDGINDAPALAQADIGIAIGSGSDVAKETGGIILIKDDLRDVLLGINLSRATMKKIKQNLFWAFAYNAAAIPLAALGLLNPIIAAAAMALSSLTVVVNSALLKRWKVPSQLIVFGLAFSLVLYNLFGAVHTGYGSDRTIFHKININDSAEQLAKTSDSYAGNLENQKKNDNKSLDYEVKIGNTISAIAQKYNVEINAILQANNLTTESIIKPGQKLALPSPKIDFRVQTVVSGNDSAGNQANNLEDDNRSESKPFDYEVESGDTVSNIAERYNLKISTILWANNLTVKTIIKPGEKLILLPVDGVLHKIKKGETIGEVALAHKADPQKTIDYNDINDPTRIYPGDLIIIPDGQPMPPLPKPRITQIPKPSKNTGNSQQENPALNLTDKLLWPTPATKITQGYWSKHRGIDIANGGTPPIFASHDGVVEFAGKSGDWGNTVLLRRDDGLVTRYSHASEIYVTIGQNVNTGNTIAKIGTTGRSTGNHLDFRVYKNGVAVNPLNLF